MLRSLRLAPSERGAKRNNSKDGDEKLTVGTMHGNPPANSNRLLKRAYVMLSVTWAFGPPMEMKVPLGMSFRAERGIWCA
jgi:hypothetical protein